MAIKKTELKTKLLLYVLICICIVPMIIAQEHPDDIYWDRGFGRQSGTSAAQNVYDMIVYNNQPIACGRLSSYQPIPNKISNILAWDGIEYVPLSNGTSFYGRSMVEYKNKLIVGGHGNNGNSISEWDGFSWSTLDTGLNGNIEAMTVMNDSLFVGGWFQKDSNSYAWSIAVWDGSLWGKLDGTFNGKINALTVYNNQLIVGGDFTYIDLQNMNALTKRNNNSWVTFYYSPGYSVTDIVVWDTMLVVAGDLYQNNKIGVYNSLDSLRYLPFSDSLNEVSDLIIYNNQITVSTRYTDSLLPGATILTWDGTSWSSIGDNLLGNDLSMGILGDSLFVFGRTNLSGQLYYHRSAMWNRNEWKLNYDNGLLWNTNESVLFQNKIVITGFFDYVGNEISNKIAMFDSEKWIPLGVTDGVNVAGLYSHQDTLYAGGWFSEIGGISVNSAAMYDGTTWTDIGFTSMCQPHDFIHYHNQLIVGGSYLVIDSDTVTLAYRENDMWVPFDQQPNDDVGSFIIYNNNLIMSGSFDSVGTTPAKNLAMWDGNNWTALVTSTNTNYSYIGKMIVKNDTLVITGYFNEVNGVQAENIAFWDGNNWSSINLNFGENNDYIGSVVEYNNQMVLGGNFDSIGGVAANNIAIWDGATFSPLGSGITNYPGWNSPVPLVSDLRVFQDELYVFGQFFMAGGIESNNIARWTKYNVSTDIAFDEAHLSIPSEYTLHQNYPNPFNPTTEILFTLPKNSNVTLEVFNILGQKVSTLVDSYKTVGTHTVAWDASNLSSGIYLYRLKADNFVSEKKMLLIK